MVIVGLTEQWLTARQLSERDCYSRYAGGINGGGRCRKRKSRPPQSLSGPQDHLQARFQIEPFELSIVAEPSLPTAVFFTHSHTHTHTHTEALTHALIITNKLQDFIAIFSLES